MACVPIAIDIDDEKTEDEEMEEETKEESLSGIDTDDCHIAVTDVSGTEVTMEVENRSDEKFYFLILGQTFVSRQSMAVNCGNNVAQNAGAGETSWQKWEIGEVKKKGKVVWAESYGKFILASLINEICFELGIIFLFYFNIIGILGGCLEFTCHKCHIGWLLFFCYCQS